MAMNYGVSYYTKGVATIDVFFPEGNTTCRYCQFCYDPKDELKRWKCRLTGEYIYTPMVCVGEKCPVKIKEE